MHFLEHPKTIFGIDLRSLALFRISLATMIVVDLIVRTRDLSAFYTDQGVLTRAESIADSHFLRTSIYWITGSDWLVALLFGIAGVAAIFLGLGYRTRLMAVISWLMLMSLQNRTTFLLAGSDNLLLLMAFWAMFLPIHAHWSVDSALGKHAEKDANGERPYHDKYFSVISIAVLLQVAFLYFFTAILKTGDPWRVTMDAAYYAVHLDQFATFFGFWLREFPTLLTAGTYFVWWLELLMPILVFSPFLHTPMRLCAIVLLVAMHGAFLLSLNIGLFPLIDFVSLTLFLPSAFWNWAQAKTQKESRNKVLIYYDRDCGFCKKTCLILKSFLLPPHTPILIAQDTPEIYEIMERENSWVVRDHTGITHTHWNALQYLFTLSPIFGPLGQIMGWKIPLGLGNRIYRWVAKNRGKMGIFSERFLPHREIEIRAGISTQLFITYILYVVAIINISGVEEWSIPKPRHVELTEALLRLDQSWGMFAPYPLTVSVVPVIPGTLRDGTAVDVYQMKFGSPDWDYQTVFPSSYENYRWRKYLGRVRSLQDNRIRLGYGQYLCQKWNSQGLPKNQELATFEIHFKTLETKPDYAERIPHTHKVWRHWCFSEYKPASLSSG